MTDTVCALCGTNENAAMLYPANVRAGDFTSEVFSARRLPDRIHEAIFRCKECGLVYPKRLVDDEMLKVLYERSVFTYTDEEPFIRATYKRYLAKALMRLTTQKRPLAYLDIGCGNGFMLEAAQELGFTELRGVEPSSDSIAKAKPDIRPYLIQGLFSPSLVGSERFDLVTCFQTLDHIPDPVQFAIDMMSILKPGGLVLCINHNIASWTARILGERCPMIDIEHTFLHTPVTMRFLFSRTGFADIDVFSVRNDYPLYCWVRLLPLPQQFKISMIAVLRRIGIGNIVIPFYPGNLGLIARRP